MALRVMHSKRGNKGAIVPNVQNTVVYKATAKICRALRTKLDVNDLSYYANSNMHGRNFFRMEQELLHSNGRYSNGKSIITNFLRIFHART